jgi:integrase
MAAALTIKALENLKAGPARREIPDGLLPGLYFVLQPSGKASWAVRYRAAGRPCKLTLGPYPVLDLKNARERARAALAKAATGVDPGAEKKAVKTAAPAIVDHVENVVARFIAQHAARKLKPGTAKEVERLLEKEVAAPWHGRRLSQIGRADVHVLLDDIVERGSPISANRTAAWLRRLCAWAIERGLIDTNPCAGVKPPAAEKSRDRILGDEELRAVWRASEMLEWPYAAFIKLLILTGARRSEVAAMTWREFDFAGKLWVIPKERCKNSVEHHIPLPDLAIDILKACPHIGDSDFVLTFSGRTPITGFAIIKNRLDTALPAEMPPWVFHDLRRTFASGCAKLGINLPVIEKLLNHTSGSFAGIVGVYQRHSFADEKRVAIETWARHVEALVSGGAGGNVIPMTRPDTLAHGGK